MLRVRRCAKSSALTHHLRSLAKERAQEVRWGERQRPPTTRANWSRLVLWEESGLSSSKDITSIF